MAGSERRRHTTRQGRHGRQKSRVLALETLETRTFLSGSQILLGAPTQDLYDFAPLYQPYVSIDMQNGAQDLGPTGSGSDAFGDPTPYNYCLLDTGATAADRRDPTTIRGSR